MVCDWIPICCTTSVNENINSTSDQILPVFVGWYWCNLALIQVLKIWIMHRCQSFSSCLQPQFPADCCDHTQPLLQILSPQSVWQHLHQPLGASRHQANLAFEIICHRFFLLIGAWLLSNEDLAVLVLDFNLISVQCSYCSGLHPLRSIQNRTKDGSCFMAVVRLADK